MKAFCCAHRSSLLAPVLLFLCALFGSAAAAAPALTVGESGANLYSQQSTDSPQLAALQKGEPLYFLAEAVGAETWYLVRTGQDLIGWVRAVDVTVPQETKDLFTKEEILTASTWSAHANDGAKFDGTWSVEPPTTAKSASGSWTLRDSDGKTVLRGTWSAEKFTTGWNGVWRARAENGKEEYSGSWSADFPHGENPRFEDLFEAAARDFIRGVWTGRGRSGTWAIRAAG